MPVLNLVVAVLRGSIGRVIAVLRDRLLLLSLLVERFVLTLINEDYYYYYSKIEYANDTYETRILFSRMNLCSIALKLLLGLRYKVADG